MEKFKSDSGSLVPGDDMSTNLQMEQPALRLLLPVYHCYAELTAEIQNPVQERGTVTHPRRAEQVGGLASRGRSSERGRLRSRAGGEHGPFS